MRLPQKWPAAAVSSTRNKPDLKGDCLKAQGALSACRLHAALLRTGQHQPEHVTGNTAPKDIPVVVTGTAQVRLNYNRAWSVVETLQASLRVGLQILWRTYHPSRLLCANGKVGRTSHLVG